MIQRLQGQVLDAHHFVNRIVEEAADAGAPHTCGFRFQIQDLPDQARLPEQAWIPPGAALPQAPFEFRQHAE